MPDNPQDEARYFGQLGTSVLPGILGASRRWHHCASVPAVAPHHPISLVRRHPKCSEL